MPGNFKIDLEIEEEDKRIWPSGSLGEPLLSIAKAMVAKRSARRVALHLWVAQQQDEETGGGAFMQALGDMSGDDAGTWKTRREPAHDVHHHGKFKTGPAFATAVAISDAPHVMDWWSATIHLTDPKDARKEVAAAS
jgi:hypothetical protein